MLRKVFHIVITFLLVSSTAGVTVSRHYCENNLFSVSFYGNADPCQHRGHDSCCRDLKFHFRLNDQFEMKQSAVVPVLTVQSAFIFSLPYASATRENFLHTNPPAVLKFPLTGHTDLARLQRYLL